MTNIVRIKHIAIGDNLPLVLISGPCVIEDYETTYEIAAFLKDLTAELDIPFIFKASYDKANRTSIRSYRGRGSLTDLKFLNESSQRLASLSFRMFTG